MWINPVHVLRGLQFLFAFIILGTDSYVAHEFNTAKWSKEPCPNSIAFMIFSAVFTILIVIPYTVIAPRWFPAATNKWVMLSTEIVSAIFWFCGFIANANLIREFGRCVGTMCDSAKAATVFGAFEFLLFAGTGFFAIRHVFHRGDEGRKGRTMAMHRGWVGKEEAQSSRIV